MPNSNKYMSRYVSDRYLRLKVRAVEYKGGKCKNCNYDKCYAALEFHHRDPRIKEATWSKLRKLSWDRIKAELDKCDLLCANCHREEHFDPNLLAIVQQRHQERQYEYLDQQCEQCLKKFVGPLSRRFCSHECARKNREKTNWPEDLPELVAASSLRALARQLGVSDKAVKKRLQNHFGNEMDL